MNMNNFKIPFAYTESGDVIDLSTAEKKTTYFCQCGSEVRVRGGEIIPNHFYHFDNGKKCSLESAIHKAYKDVFYSLKKIKLPYTINGKSVLEFDRVELEKKIDTFIPDAIGYIGEDKYLIEFAKSSYIGKRKEDAIKKANLFCLEIDIIKNVRTLNDIRNHLENESNYKHVIHIPEYKELTEVKEKFLKLSRKFDRKIKEAENKEIELSNENLRLRDEVENLRDQLSLAQNKIRLKYRCLCKNGSHMFTGTMKDGNKINAFVNEDSLNIVLETPEYSRQKEFNKVFNTHS